MIKSIKKARKNGWDKFDHFNKFEMVRDDHVRFISDNKTENLIGVDLVHINEIIFDIDFAKAIWGERECRKYYTCHFEPCKHIAYTKKDFLKLTKHTCRLNANKKYSKKLKDKLNKDNIWIFRNEQSEVVSDGFQYHLQKIAIEEDRIAYLKKYEI